MSRLSPSVTLGPVRFGGVTFDPFIVVSRKPLPSVGVTQIVTVPDL